MRQRIPARAWNAFIVVAIAVFLLFVGVSIYPVLWPIHHWNVECPALIGEGGKVLLTTNFEIKESQVEGVTAFAKRRKCTVNPARQFLLAGRVLP